MCCTCSGQYTVQLPVYRVQPLTQCFVFPDHVRQTVTSSDQHHPVVFAGDITSKGFEKKRARLLAPYATKQPSSGKLQTVDDKQPKSIGQQFL